VVEARCGRLGDVLFHHHHHHHHHFRLLDGMTERKPIHVDKQYSSGGSMGGAMGAIAPPPEAEGVNFL